MHCFLPNWKICIYPTNKKKNQSEYCHRKWSGTISQTCFHSKWTWYWFNCRNVFIWKINTIEAALSGARDIIAEWISDDINARNKVRSLFEKHGILISKVKKERYRWSEIQGLFWIWWTRKNIPSHRFGHKKRRRRRFSQNFNRNWREFCRGSPRKNLFERISWA